MILSVDEILFFPKLIRRCALLLTSWFRVSDKFDDPWYQKNLPSDDETRQLIDPNQSDDSSMNLSFEAFAQGSKFNSHSIVSPATSKSQTEFTTRQEESTLTAGTAARMLTDGKVNSTLKTSSDLGNSYHTDSLSSEEATPTHNKIQAAGSVTQVTVQYLISIFRFYAETVNPPCLIFVSAINNKNKLFYSGPTMLRFYLFAVKLNTNIKKRR